MVVIHSIFDMKFDVVIFVYINLKKTIFFQILIGYNAVNLSSGLQLIYQNYFKKVHLQNLLSKIVFFKQ